MADPADKKGPLDPDELVAARIRTSLRGFDQLEVRALLNRAAERIRKLESTIERLRDDLDSAVRRPARVADLDEESLTAALGEETARVLRSAREAATEIVAAAETKSAELLRAAEAQAHALRNEAEGLVIAEREKASAAGAEILEKAKAAGRKELERGRAEGRRLVAEARSLRTRMLEDLADKRRSGLAHLESLRAAREELLRTYASVEETVTRVTSELSRADAAARVAAEEAVVDLGEPEEQLAELEELAAKEPVAREELVPSPAEGEEDRTDDGEAAEPAGEDRPRFELREQADAGAGGDGGDGGDGEDQAPDDEADRSERSGRRTSALRILRRAAGRARDDDGDDEDVAEATPPEGFRTVEVGERKSEGVRVLGAKADESAEAEPAEPEPEELEPEEPEEAEPEEVEPEEEEPEAGVGDLFDRIRAEREAATEWARGVLGDAQAPPGEGDTPADTATDEAVAGADDSEVGGAEEAPVADRPPAFAARDEAVEEAVASLVRALKRTLGDEQNEVLAVVRGAKGVPTVDDVLPPGEEHGHTYAAAVAADLASVARTGDQCGGGSGEPETDELAGRLGHGLAEPLRQRVEAVLDEAKGNVDGNVVDELELADRVSAVYRQWRRQRLEKAAREALREAFAVGVQAAASAAGRSVEWVIDPVHPACSPDCEDNALAGPVKPGDPFPAGGTHPPAHVECRCLVLPAD